MSQANPIISTFNAGELSPLIGGRPDLAKYQAGLSVCRNFIPRVQGALVRRGGTRFVAEVKDSAAASATRLARFVFAANDAFVLEFGERYIRFYKDHGVLLLQPVTWAADVTYGPGAYVVHDAINYYCTAANTNEPPANATYWRPEAWSSSTAYVVGDIASATGVKYYCRQAHSDQAPGETDYWHALDGDIYEVPTPWPGSALTSDKDGAMGVRYTQSGDVLYLVHPGYAPQKLTRRGDIDWTIEPFVPDGGPFKDQNEDEDSKVWVVAEGPNLYVHATAPLFDPKQAGALFYIEMQDGSGIKPWEVYQPVSVGEVRRSDGKYYQCTAIGGVDPQYTGTEKPIHTSGAYWDGDGLDKDTDDKMGSLGAEWTYIHPGYGWVRITNVPSAHIAQVEVVSRLPDEVYSIDFGATRSTWRWALPAWSDLDGWPSAVAFFRDRLAFGAGQTVWFSQAGDYQNFKAKDFGEQLPSSAFGVLVQSGHGDPVEWLAPTQKLLAGTGGSVHAIGEGSTTQPFAPANARQEDQVMPGTSGVQPISAGTIIYAEASGRILNEAAFSAEDNRFTPTDLTVFAEHITRSGVTAMAFAKQPHAVNWCVRADGGLVGMTFHKDQQVIGWHEQVIGGRFRASADDAYGPAVVEDVCVIPSPEVRDGDGRVVTPGGVRDDVWLVVKRTIGGATRRYVEYLVAEYQDGDDLALSPYADCHLTYQGAAKAELGGLAHLAGETVQVKADGAAHTDCVVTFKPAHGDDPDDWIVTLDAPASKAVVGLAAPAQARLMPLEAGATLGTSQARIKRVNRATFRLVDSLGGAVGPDFLSLAPLEYRHPTDAMDAPPPIFTGDKRVEFPGDYDAVATIAIQCDQGFPFTLVAIMPELTTYEG